ELPDRAIDAEPRTTITQKPQNSRLCQFRVTQKHERPTLISRIGRFLSDFLVGARGFEPPTPRSRTECSTRLSHAPTGELGFFQKSRPDTNKSSSRANYSITRLPNYPILRRLHREFLDGFECMVRSQVRMQGRD